MRRYAGCWIEWAGGIKCDTGPCASLGIKRELIAAIRRYRNFVDDILATVIRAQAGVAIIV